MEKQKQPTPEIQTPEQHQVIPAAHQENLRRTMQIAAMVRGDEMIDPTDGLDWSEPLEVSVVGEGKDVPAELGVYLIDGEIDTERHEQITETEFTLSPKILSGKVDSAHAVLPGTLSVFYSEDKEGEHTDIEVAAKGFFKRGFAERLGRVKTETTISKMQEEAGELAFSTVAVVVAPPEFKGKGTDHSQFDILLITKLDKSITTLDNAPWQLGYSEANLNLAESAVNALGRFNNRIGKHGDAKVKNVAQQPDGKTGMIDFETSEIIAEHTPYSAADVTMTDLGTLFDSMDARGLFARDPSRAQDVLTSLGESYLQHWADSSNDVQDAVFEQVTYVIDSFMQSSTERNRTLQAA